MNIRFTSERKEARDSEVRKMVEYSLKALINVCHQSPKRGRLKVHLGP
jgi:hypothetical protein